MDFKEIECIKLKRSYEFTFKKTLLNQKIEEKLENERSNFQMKGFRKGHTPLKLMIKMFGKSTKNEILQNLLDSSVRNHLKKLDHKPAYQPKIDIKSGNIEKETDLTFSISYEILPKIPELNYENVSINEYNIKVEDKAINNALEELAKSAPTYEVKKKTEKAVLGDQLIIDFNGSINKKEFDGGTAVDYPLIIGSKSFIPGFEDQLANTKINEQKLVKVNFPDNYANKDLAGKNAEFMCKIKKISKPIPAKINDDLAVKFSAKNLTELKSNIRDRLINEYLSLSKSLMRKELMDELEKNMIFDLPQSLVKSELDQISQHSAENSSDDKKAIDKKKPTNEQIKIADRRVKLGLFFAEEGNRNGITVSEKEFKESVLKESVNFPGKEEDFLKFVDNNPSVKEQISAPIFENKVFDHIIKLVNKKQINISFEQFKKKFDSNIK